jgi:hypothetical protein
MCPTALININHNPIQYQAMDSESLRHVAPPLTLHLASDPLFKNIAYDSFLSLDDRLELAYKRARAIAKTYGK